MIINGYKYSPSQLRYLGVSDDLIKEYQKQLGIIQVKRDFNNDSFIANEKRLKDIEKQIFEKVH